MARVSGVLYDKLRGEDWRDIEDWPDYQISSLGRVRHWQRRNWWMIKQSKQHGHKKYVVLARGKHWTVMVDRLVMQAFVGKRSGRRIIHLNHDTDDNALENMRYATPAEYLQWIRDHWKAIGKTKCADREAEAARLREQDHQRHYEAARLWLSGKATLKVAASTISISESGLSWWVKRHNLK